MAVYLHLFHGRSAPDEDMEDWGFDGPVLGPFKYLHMTYLNDLKFSMEVEAYKKAFPEEARPYEYEGYVEGHFHSTSDLIIYQGKYYGDFSICTREVFEADKLLPKEETP